MEFSPLIKKLTELYYAKELDFMWALVEADDNIVFELAKEVNTYRKEVLQASNLVVSDAQNFKVFEIGHFICQSILQKRADDKEFLKGLEKVTF